MADTIKEFLISLGFKVDETSFRKFKDGVGVSSADVAKLGLAATGTAVAVAAAVVKISKEYENLYWASQRTGATVANLQAVSYAASQIGLSADQGKGAIEAMAASMRMNPGLQGLAGAYGASAKDPVERLQQLVTGMKKAFGPDGYFAAAMQAANFGIPEPVFFQMWTNIDKMKEEAGDYKQRAKEAGLNTEELARSSNEFQTSLRKLGSDLGIFSDKMYANLVKPAQEAVEWFDKLVQSVNKITSISAEQHHEGLKEKRDKFRAGVRGWMGEHEWQDRPFWMLPDLAESEKHTPGAVANPTAPRENANSIRIPPNGSDRRDFVADYFKKQGWSKAQAWAIAGTLSGETANFNPAEVGDGGLAYGVAQWHPERQHEFKEWAGHDIRGSDIAEQLAFVQHELTKGKYRRAGDHLRQQDTARGGVSVLVPEYERPADTYGNIRSRGDAADRWFRADLGRPAAPSTPSEPTADQPAETSPNIAQHNNLAIHINGVTDPEGLRGAMRDGADELTRHLMIRMDAMR
jgi:hypothetical protein